MVDSSFYADGEVYDTAVVETNDHGASLTPSQAPSGFYPGGTIYNEADTAVAADYVAEAAASATSAAASASEAAAAGVTAVANAAGTATPIVDGTAAVGSSTKWAHEDHVHPTDTSRASVTAMGLKADKTYVDTQDALKADTTYVNTQLALKADKTYVDTQDALKAPIASPTFTGSMTLAPSGAGAYYNLNAPASYQATINFNSAGALKWQLGKDTDNRFYLWDNVAGTSVCQSASGSGYLTVVTPTAGDNSTKVATTAFTKTYADGLAGTVGPAMDGAQAVGTSTKWAHEDHVHPTDTSRAPVASPTFTGAPAAPTPTAGDNSTKIATTQFVATAVSGVTTPSGAPIKVAQTVDTTNRSVSSTSYAATFSIASSFTPASSSNKLRVQVTGITGSSASVSVSATLFRSINGGAWTDLTPAGAGELCGTIITSSVLASQMVIDFIDSPGTTLPVQYQVYLKSNAASTLYLGRRAADAIVNTPTVFTVTEIKG